jgi:hypothetical protein
MSLPSRHGDGPSPPAPARRRPPSRRRNIPDLSFTAALHPRPGPRLVEAAETWAGWTDARTSGDTQAKPSDWAGWTDEVQFAIGPRPQEQTFRIYPTDGPTLPLVDPEEGGDL